MIILNLMVVWSCIPGPRICAAISTSMCSSPAAASTHKATGSNRNATRVFCFRHRCRSKQRKHSCSEWRKRTSRVVLAVSRVRYGSQRSFRWIAPSWYVHIPRCCRAPPAEVRRNGYEVFRVFKKKGVYSPEIRST